MQVPNASELKTIIATLLENCTCAIERFNSEYRTLRVMGVNLKGSSDVYWPTAIQDCIDSYFAKLGRDLTSANCKGLPATVELDERLYAVLNGDSGYSGVSSSLRRDFRNADGESVGAKLNIVRQIADVLPFESIANELDISTRELVKEGKRQLINTLVNELGLNRISPNKPRTTKRYLTFKNTGFPTWRNQHDKAAMINKLSKCLALISEETAVDFGNALDDFLVDVNKTSHMDPCVCENKTYGKNNKLQIQCFKESFNFCFQHDAFDAVLAYATNHGFSSDVISLQNVYVNDMQEAV